MRHVIILLAAAAYCGPSCLRGTTLDPNFSESQFASVGSTFSGMAWAPDGSNRLFAILQTGQIVIVKNGTVLPTPFATISPILTVNECGLVGICFDPNFVVNGYVYVFVTVSATEQQIVRYTAVGDLGVGKTVLVPGLPTRGANHNGGGLDIGPDGKLYWSIGDLGDGTGVDADLVSLAAKVGRANLNGTVPADNPFVDGPGGNDDYIWARGFRNPFTLTFQPEAETLWVNCVGTLYEQVFLVTAGDHAGWNDYENNQPAGFITPRIKYRTNGTDTRSIAGGTGAVRTGNVAAFTTTVAHGFRQGERITIAGVPNASFNGAFYVASVPSDTTFTVAQTGADATSGGGTATTLNQGGCVTGGCFYDSTAVPAAYRQNFFYGDLNSGRLMRAVLNGANEVTSVDYFVTGSPSQIDAAIGPDGALYYGNYSGTILRLAYTNYVGQQLVVTPTVVPMVENGAAMVNVRLATAPAGPVQVSIARTSGDPNVIVAAGASLTFGPTNWSVPQSVRVEAAPDMDATNGVASLSVSAAGLASELVSVRALDQFAPFSLQFEAGPAPVEVRLNGEQGRTYVLEKNFSLTSAWTPIGTNTLTGSSTNLTDPDATVMPQAYYRARLVP